ncbi:hypothetical protein CkaCkLH20_02215 [Colletotrichum karsti]|uniref:Chromo domain-containing protein n=1 Tax=Colletotrichum karsti TaxID=1095194 RepID=A0A9P6LPC7_9PEZI|nr:uncharacterized protein CkaCkLH20_02215 [Colletotrichum karsti]KAF9880261.1 hypothetical protein CkaCkLH20_02215 [Colletotrichum karsti]
MELSGLARALGTPNKKARGRTYMPSVGMMRQLGARALGLRPTASRQQLPLPDSVPAEDVVTDAPDNQPQPETIDPSPSKATTNTSITNPSNEQDSGGENNGQRSRICSEDRTVQTANTANDNSETEPTDAANGHVDDTIDLAHIKKEPEDDHPLQASSTPADVTDQQWELRAIVGHEVDPEDPTRLRLRCRWANTDPKNNLTWEPECIIQEDAPAMWKSYVTKRNPRKDLGEYQDYWHILGIKGHTKAKGGKFKMKISWVGFEKDETVSEDFVEDNNAELLKEYWQSVGGRESAVQARPTRKRKRARA